jgi:hypothetical protein
MKAYVTRDSVTAGDDVDAPHEIRLDLPYRWEWNGLIDEVWRSSRLPQIVGGCATWVLSSGIPLAIAAQEWKQPKPLFLLEAEKSLVDVVEGELRLHWSYFAQYDPGVVGDIVSRLRLRAVPGGAG